MRALDTHYALYSEGVTGTPRLALLVMAIHADPRGRVAIGSRDLATKCGVSPPDAANAIRALVDQGLAQVVETGRGTTPSVYALTRPKGGVGATVAQTAEGLSNAQNAAQNKAKGKIVENGEFSSVKHDVIARNDVSVNADAKPITESPQTHAEGVFHAVEAFDDGATGSRARSPAPASTPELDRSQAGAGSEPADDQGAVSAVLAVAGVQPPQDQPFYWSRREHQNQLRELLTQRRQTCDQLCADLRAAREAGATYESVPRTMAHVVSIAPDGMRWAIRWG